MKILVPIEDPYFAAALLDFIAGHKWPDGTEFCFLHVIEPFLLDQSSRLTFARLLSLSESELIKAANRLLEDCALELRKRLPYCQVTFQLKTGRVLGEILSVSREGNFDLIVAGSHGRSGFNQLFLGSVSLALLNDAACPVLLVKPDLVMLKDWEQVSANAMSDISIASLVSKPDKSRTCRKILLCVDGEALAHDLLDFVSKHDFRPQAKFKILSVVPSPGWLGFLPVPERDRLQEELMSSRREVLEKLKSLLESSRSEWAIETELSEGQPKSVILDAARAWDADLIVLGAKVPGENGNKSIGSVSLHVLSSAPCSVLFLREKARALKESEALVKVSG